MAYDNFENTPFDLDHDGHIDSNEAAYIYETFYNEDNLEDEDNSFGGGYISNHKSSYNGESHDKVLQNISNGKLPSGKTMKELEQEVRRESIRKNCVFFALFMLAGEFIGGHLLTGVIVSAIVLVVGFSVEWFLVIKNSKDLLMTMLI